MTLGEQYCGNGNWQKLVPSGTNTPFQTEAACVAYFDGGGEYVNFSPPSFTFDFWRIQRGNQYTVRWLLWDFEPGAVVPCTLIFSKGARQAAGSVTIGPDRSAVLECGEFRCTDIRGVIVGIEATIPGGTVVTEMQTEQIPCAKDGREKWDPAAIRKA